MLPDTLTSRIVPTGPFDDLQLTDPRARVRDEIKRCQKHCQRELSEPLDIQADSTTILRESERAVVKVVVGRVEARAGLRRAKCGCCNYNV